MTINLKIDSSSAAIFLFLQFESYNGGEGI